MKKIIIIFAILNSILFADLSKMINIPHKSKILSLTFRYIDVDGNIQTQKLKSNISLTSDGVLLSQSKKKHFLAKIDTEGISIINSVVVEYQDTSKNKFFKPIYYNLAIIDKNKPLYVLQTDSMAHEAMKHTEDNMPLMMNTQNNNLIDGFTLDKVTDDYDHNNMNNMKKHKVMKFKKYNIDYINKAMHPVTLGGLNVAKKEKHFCTIPIRDNIFYFTNKKALFVIFKDFELTSGMSIENNKVTIRFEQENKFRPCELKNINEHIMKMSAFYEKRNNGEVWFKVHFSKDIKSASIVYPKEKYDVMSYNEELKDIIVYKIEY